MSTGNSAALGEFKNHIVMKNYCFVLTLLFAFLVLPEGMNAQTADCNPANCNPKNCDVTKCTPEQLAQCKAVCGKVAAKDATTATNVALVNQPKTAAKKCCAIQPGCCTSGKKVNNTKTATTSAKVIKVATATEKKTTCTSTEKKCCASKAAAASQKTSTAVTVANPGKSE